MVVLTGGMLDVKNTAILCRWHENFKEATALMQWFFTLSRQKHIEAAKILEDAATEQEKLYQQQCQQNNPDMDFMNYLAKIYRSAAEEYERLHDLESADRNWISASGIFSEIEKRDNHSSGMVDICLKHVHK